MKEQEREREITFSSLEICFEVDLISSLPSLLSGVEWLWGIYCNAYGGGILGDDMGLGRRRRERERERRGERE
jgi:SNF2 family DNA or RNA helicase